MRYLADTSFLIDLVNGDQGAISIAKEVDLIGERMGLSVISVEEYIRGIYYLYWKEENKLKRKVAQALNDLNAFEIIPMDQKIAIKTAEIEVKLIKKGEMLSLPDLIIAATALTHNLILVTRNIKHFNRIEELTIRTY